MADKDTLPVGGSANPYDFLSLVAALSASQSKPTQSGINRLFMPELGVLTGTYFPGDTAAQSEQEDAAMMLRLAPDVLRAANLPAGDLRAKIANMIFGQKIPVWDVKRRIDQELVERQKLGEVIDVDETASEMYAFADKIQSQADAVEANVATAAAKPRTDVFSQAGLPSPEQQFAPEELAPDYFKKYAEESAGRSERLRKIQAPSAASQKAAAKFLAEQQAAEKAISKDNYVPYYPTGSEGLRSSLSRNLANTPMGRGEAGFRGLIPLLKMVEQVPAGAAALYRGVTDPLNQEIAQNARFVAEEMFGREISNMEDPAGQILYGKSRNKPKPVEDKAEMRRFGTIAKGIVARGEDKGLSKERAALLEEQKYADTVRDLVAAGLTKKAQEAGYTPLMIALLKRAQFSNVGGG